MTLFVRDTLGPCIVPFDIQKGFYLELYLHQMPQPVRRCLAEYQKV